MQYRHPFDGTYSAEPSDEEANVLARALAHWITSYLVDEKDRTAQIIVLDILESNAASIEPMTRDECERIAAAVGVEV